MVHSGGRPGQELVRSWGGSVALFPGCDCQRPGLATLPGKLRLASQALKQASQRLEGLLKLTAARGCDGRTRQVWNKCWRALEGKGPQEAGNYPVA
jgi:hypothetical protein